MMNKKIGVITASGIGDGLIFHIISHHLVEMGCDVVTFNDHLSKFGEWFKGYRFAKQPLPNEIPPLFQEYDALILQHDNSLKAKEISNLPLPIYRFYGSHKVEKQGPLKELDYVADRTLTMVQNVEKALLHWFGTSSRENGLKPPPYLIHKKYPSRIAIHPTSGVFEKNWPRAKFTLVEKRLKEMGYDPFCLIDLTGNPQLPSLESLASFLYESGAFLGNDSGPGHLASALQIPTLILGKEKKELALWRPGWLEGIVLSPPTWTSKSKITKKLWKRFITTRRVIKVLNEMMLKN